MVYPDLGNITNGTSDILTDIETGRGYIAAAHLKETLPGKFREIPYGSGNVNFPAGIAVPKEKTRKALMASRVFPYPCKYLEI